MLNGHELVFHTVSRAFCIAEKLVGITGYISVAARHLGKRVAKLRRHGFECFKAYSARGYELGNKSALCCEKCKKQVFGLYRLILSFRGELHRARECLKALFGKFFAVHVFHLRTELAGQKFANSLLLCLYSKLKMLTNKARIMYKM